MEIVKLKSGDISEFKNLIEIFNEVFENNNQVPDERYLKKLLSNKEFMVFVIRKANRIIGGLTIYILQSYYTEKPVAYIYDVGITPNFQGQGLGKSLISEVCDYCKKNGFEDAYVEAEADDIDAIGFYRKTKYSKELNATHFIYSFNNKK